MEVRSGRLSNVDNSPQNSSYSVCAHRSYDDGMGTFSIDKHRNSQIGYQVSQIVVLAVADGSDYQVWVWLSHYASGRL